MDDAVAYQVLGYADVRDVAVDAAATALERQEQRTSEDLRLLADEAATAAASAVSGQVGSSQQEELTKVADESASKASQQSLEQVQAKLDAQVETLDAMAKAQAESLDTVAVTLADDQWQYVHDSMQVMSTCAVLGLLLQALLVGVMLSRMFLDGWRR